jgi:hypothetical protein
VISLSHSGDTQKGELQEPAIGTLIHSCWIKIQRPDLGQYSIGTVGQYSVGANNDTKESLLTDGSLKPALKKLWDNLPIFRDSMKNVPTLHVPLSKSLIETSLRDGNFMIATKTNPDIFRYKP